MDRSSMTPENRLKELAEWKLSILKDWEQNV
jgi:hypothetical protein